jgi:DNA-binding beta-propeller fold protein YncE
MPLMSKLETLQGFGSPASVPALGYEPVPDIFQLPPGVNFGPCSGVAVNSQGHIFVFHRGQRALMEFDPAGGYLRCVADGLFTRPHGLRIDAEDNIWATDIGSHVVVKMNRQGRIQMVLGLKDSNAPWHHAGYMRGFDEPNDVAFGPAGEIYVSQGHGKGESRIVAFDANGDFIKTWGGEGDGPGQFNQPHSIVATSDGTLLVADRSNQRIQVFDRDGNYLRESSHSGKPCGLCLCRDQQHLFLAHGHACRIMKLDIFGTLLGVGGSPGKGPNQYGEAHYLALSNDEKTLYVADTLNWRVQALIKSA